MAAEKWLKHYTAVVRLFNPNINPQMLLMISGALFLVSVLLLLLGFYFTSIVALVLATFIAFWPYKEGIKKIENIEENLGDALREMAAVLRSGGTFEVALREVVASEYGELSKQFSQMLKEIEAGKSFIAALNSLSMRIESDFLRKTVLIITDSIRTGGRVADVLDEIAEDIRKTYQIKKDRKARVSMQFMFIFISATVLGPYIVGMSMGIQLYMMNIGEENVKKGMMEESIFLAKVATSRQIDNILTLYIIVQAVLAGVVAALIRSGKLSDAALYVPVMLLLAYIFFTIGKFTVLSLTKVCTDTITCLLGLIR